MRRGLVVRAAAGVATAVLVSSACSGSSPPPSHLGIVADAGFRPTSNGFAFQNYGGQLASGVTPTNLTAHDVQQLFGDRVCVDAQLRKCDLIPEAQAWLDETNQAMAGGHCYGFSVLSELIWQGKVNASTLGAPAPNSLAIDDNQALQRQIAYDWALQTLDSVQSRRITGTPNQILSKLRQVLKPHPTDTYTIALWKRDGTGGHAVTPYAVDNKGDGNFAVMIYDNNWPDQTRAISFDTKADTWSYDAAANPGVPESVYEGDASTKTISLFPTSPGLGTQPCPFCAQVPNSTKSAAGKGNTEEISLLASDTNDANVVVTDAAGHHLGYVNGKLVEEIPGSRADEVIANQDWTDRMAPDYFVPADARYTIVLDGSALTAADTETLRVIGPSFDLSVSKISMKPGDKDTLVIEPDATKISYTSSRVETPTLQLGVSENKADYTFEIAGVSDRPGSTVNLSLPAEGGNLSVQNVGSTVSSTVNIKVTRESEQGVQLFQHGSIPLAGGAVAQLQFGNWTKASPGMPLVTIQNGQQSNQTLTNQAPH